MCTPPCCCFFGCVVFVFFSLSVFLLTLVYLEALFSIWVKQVTQRARMMCREAAIVSCMFLLVLHHQHLQGTIHASPCCYSALSPSRVCPILAWRTWFQHTLHSKGVRVIHRFTARVHCLPFVRFCFFVCGACSAFPHDAHASSSWSRVSNSPRKCGLSPVCNASSSRGVRFPADC